MRFLQQCLRFLNSLQFRESHRVDDSGLKMIWDLFGMQRTQLEE